VAEFALHAPHSLAEASALLARYAGEARAIAGGTALVLMLRQGLVSPPALVRLDGIPDLAGIAIEDGTLQVGALTPLRAVAESALVREHLPALAGACALVGNVRVRNAATLGGNLCEADYASDPPGVLVAHDARVVIHGAAGARELPVAELIQDFYETALAPDELVAAVRVPLAPAARQGTYLKYVTRSAEDRPCVGVTALVARDGDERLNEVRVAVGAVAGRPLRLPAAEAMARGERPADDLFAAIGEAYAAAVEPVADARGSSAYRRKMVAVFVRRALRAAAAGDHGARKV
jgi:carbon-monoxide dehydrogenase medium subunit